jgi:hypothetical protein
VSKSWKVCVVMVAFSASAGARWAAYRAGFGPVKEGSARGARVADGRRTVIDRAFRSLVGVDHAEVVPR